MNKRFDAAVAAIVKGVNIQENLRRLYLSGDLDSADLALCVERGLLSLEGYNDIVGDL